MISRLFENERVLAVNKPEGLAAIPEAAGDLANVRAQLEAELGQKLFVVHRLDKDVSGVIVFARDAEMHRFLNRQFATREVHKVYLAVVAGVVRRKRSRISAPLREFGSGRMGVDREGGGKRALTQYRVVERLPAHTLLEVEPVTGRRHQIRVHLYIIGHPICGDLRYGERAQQTAYPRLMLHAAAIALPMPDGTVLRVEAHPPESFTNALAALRAAPPARA